MYTYGTFATGCMFGILHVPVAYLAGFAILAHWPAKLRDAFLNGLGGEDGTNSAE
jgi:hypothetical protein